MSPQSNTFQPRGRTSTWRRKKAHVCFGFVDLQNIGCDGGLLFRYEDGEVLWYGWVNLSEFYRTLSVTHVREEKKKLHN